MTKNDKAEDDEDDEKYEIGEEESGNEPGDRDNNVRLVIQLTDILSEVGSKFTSC